MMNQDLATRVRTRLILAEAASPGGVSGWGLQNLADKLFGRGAKKDMLSDLIGALVGQGALIRSMRGDLTPGPAWADAVKAASASVIPVSAGDFMTSEDMVDSLGSEPVRLSRNQTLMDRLHWTLLEALEQKRSAGALRPIETTVGRVAIADQWNEYLGIGAIGARLMHYLTRAIPTQIDDVLEYGLFTEEEIPGKLKLINDTLAAGFRFGRDGSGMGAGLTAEDRNTGRTLMVCMNNWHPEFWQSEPENNYEPVRVQLGLAAPPVLHFDLGEDEGPILILSGRSGDARITDALYQAHIENGDSWHELNSNEGRIGHAVACYGRTGILPLVLGDVFPSPSRHLPTGILALSVYGEVVDEATAAELEAEGDEDWKAGYFLKENPDMAHTDRINFDELTICRQSRLVDLLVTTAEISEAAAIGLIEKAISDRYGSVYREEGASRHIWLAYEPEANRFSDEVRRLDVLPIGGYGRAVALLSRGPLSFDPANVRTVDLPDPPARDAAVTPEL